MARTITTRTYAIPDAPKAQLFLRLIQALQLTHSNGGDLVSVRSPWSEPEFPDGDAFHVRVRGTDNVHSAMLGQFPWVGPENGDHATSDPKPRQSPTWGPWGPEGRQGE